ncbi:MAG: hypothetical protein E5V22_18745, partial [Mesorhizobium sp.]
KGVVSLYLPSWSTDRLRRMTGAAAARADAPLVVDVRDGSRRIVTATDAAAAALGCASVCPPPNWTTLAPAALSCGKKVQHAE